jgi:hypothetical protein
MNKHIVLEYSHKGVERKVKIDDVRDNDDCGVWLSIENNFIGGEGDELDILFSPQDFLEFVDILTFIKDRTYGK